MTPRIVPPEVARALLRDKPMLIEPGLLGDLAHTAAVLGEQREAVLALARKWLAAIQDGQGVKRDHWRGQDYVDGDDFRAEECAAEVLSLLGVSDD